MGVKVTFVSSVKELKGPYDMPDAVTHIMLKVGQGVKARDVG